jgi:TRAP-type uncharacterized transport system substrate-binding protein
MSTLPYFIIGNATIKSAEGLRGRAAAVHIPGTSADFAMRLALSKVGIPYKDIKAVTVGEVRRVVWSMTIPILPWRG